MTILAIDTSGQVATCALLVDEEIRGLYSIQFKKTHSETMLPMVENMMTMVGQKVEDVDAVAVAAGPGSFTGLRIGAALAKGLCLASSKPLIAVSTLEGLTYRYYGESGIVVPIMDARRDQVYTGIYRVNDKLEVLLEPTAMSITELIDKVNSYEDNAIYLGDGIVRYRNILDEHIRDNDRIAPINNAYQSAAALALRAKEKFIADDFVDADTFAPEYIRISQAERERKERLANQ